MLSKIKGWQLDGRKALVTGGTKGIGKAICEALAQAGATVLTVARNAEQLKACLHEWQQKGLDISTRTVDVSRPEDLETLTAQIQREWGALDILVNNAGMNIRMPAENYALDTYDQIMQTNLQSAFWLTRLCHPLLKQSGAASVIYISSVAGLVHVKSGAVYGMTKAALNQLTRNLAGEWGADNIRVNAIAPWYIRTPLAEQVLQDEAYYQAVTERTPLNRIGEPEEVAGLAVYLSLPIAGYITGQCIAVDGGFTINGFAGVS